MTIQNHDNRRTPDLPKGGDPASSERRNDYQFEPYSPEPREPLRAPPPICWKQSLQYTGLSPRGWKGTRASLPQLEQVALYIWRGPRSPP